MMVRHFATAIILLIVTLFALLSAIGIVRSKNSLAALHCVGVSNVMLGPLVMLAVIVDTGFGVSSVKTLCFVAILLLGGPITSHAIALAAYRRHPK